MLTPVAVCAALLVQSTVPALGPLVARPASELEEVIERFSTDRTALTRRYDADDSPDQRRRRRELYTGWQSSLHDVDFGKLGREGRADYVLLDNYLKHQLS